jgi:hypothetical protein
LGRKAWFATGFAAGRQRRPLTGGDFGRWKNRTHRLKKGSVLTDEKARENERWSESEKEAPIIKKAAY